MSPISQTMAVPAGRQLLIGMILPATNSVNETEWRAVLPANVRLRLIRMALHEASNTETGRKRLFDDLKVTVSRFSHEKFDVLAYCCTAGSMLSPLDVLTNFMSSLNGSPSVATAPSLVHACGALNVRRVALATPYHDALNRHEIDFLEANGISVCAASGLGIGAGGPHEYAQIAQIPEFTILNHIRSVDRPDAQAVLVSCTDFPTLGSIEQLEKELGKPVVTSNSATLWAVLRAANCAYSICGFGRLFGDLGR